MAKRKKDTLKVGDIVNFHSGNYEGLTGKITNVDWIKCSKSDEARN